MPVPVALAEMNGGLRTEEKSVLAVLITSGINCPSEIELRGSSCLLIDCLALVSAIGRPFADSFQAAVLQAGSRCQHIHGIYISSVSRRFLHVRNERKTHKKGQLALSDVLLKMAMSLFLTVGQTSLHCQITR